MLNITHTRKKLSMPLKYRSLEANVQCYINKKKVLSKRSMLYKQEKSLISYGSVGGTKGIRNASSLVQ